MNQQAQVRDALLRGETITPLKALDRFGCFRLAAIVHRLRRDGDAIETVVQRKGDKTFAAYRIANKQTPAEEPPPLHSWTDESDAKLREMLGLGKTRREMARHFGINVAQIGGRVYRLGLTKPNGRRGQPKDKKQEAAK